MKNYRLLIAGLLALVLAACAAQDIPDPEPTEDRSVEDIDNNASTGGFDDDLLEGGEYFDEDMDSDGELATVFYFDFDKSEVRPEYSDLLAKHANKLANSAGINIRLEGHTDERGSREYNIGLGERRAQAVRRSLLIQGAAANQIATVSFGEERLASFGSDEGAHAQNRRVEINYIN
jgi:peptidoglycan-associated lipoprotein